MNTKKGFTIIEALVAITILVMSVTGPLALAAKGLALSGYAKDEITAFYLASEAIDVVRNIRDSNTQGATWLRLSPTTGETLLKCSGGCYFDVWRDPIKLNTTFGQTSADKFISTRLCQDDSIQYGYTVFSAPPACAPKDLTKYPDTQTIFERTVTVQDINPGKEIRVIAKVSWTAKNGLLRNVTISENLFNL